jgi:hypothetical protein
MDPSLRNTLLDLLRRDQKKRQELVDREELYLGYHPEMQAVHDANAETLGKILDRQGWPTVRRAGEDGAEAAWILATHAIAQPAFQRRCLDLLAVAAEAGEVPAVHYATLVDRIRCSERRPQIYGTQLDWDEEGRLSPWPIEDPEGVEERRRKVGLPPLDEKVRQARAHALEEKGRAPRPYAERQAEINAWARRVGWLED